MSGRAERPFWPIHRVQLSPGPLGLGRRRGKGERGQPNTAALPLGDERVPAPHHAVQRRDGIFAEVGVDRIVVLRICERELACGVEEGVLDVAEGALVSGARLGYERGRAASPSSRQGRARRHPSRSGSSGTDARAAHGTDGRRRHRQYVRAWPAPRPASGPCSAAGSVAWLRRRVPTSSHRAKLMADARKVASPDQLAALDAAGSQRRRRAWGVSGSGPSPLLGSAASMAALSIDARMSAELARGACVQGWRGTDNRTFARERHRGPGLREGPEDVADESGSDGIGRTRDRTEDL